MSKDRRREVAPDLSPSERQMEDAKQIANDCAWAMMSELALRHPSGDVQGIAVVLAKFKHPTGAEPFSVWSAYSDNLDPVFADTAALGAIVDFVVGLQMPFDLRAELCRRIMMGQGLPEGGRYIANEVIGRARR